MHVSVCKYTKPQNPYKKNNVFCFIISNSQLSYVLSLGEIVYNINGKKACITN